LGCIIIHRLAGTIGQRLATKQLAQLAARKGREESSGGRVPPSSLTVNPCARNVASVHPCGLPARISSAWSWSAPGPRFRGLNAFGHRSGSHAGGCSCQFGRAPAPMIPHRVHTIRGPNVRTGTSSDHGPALRIARWWHCQHDKSSTARLWPACCLWLVLPQCQHWRLQHYLSSRAPRHARTTRAGLAGRVGGLT
jgi:hypothetical protein